MRQLVYFCRLLRGNGHLVNGDKGVKYTHRKLPIGDDEGVRALATATVNGSVNNGPATKPTPVSNGSV